MSRAVGGNGGSPFGPPPYELPICHGSLDMNGLNESQPSWTGITGKLAGFDLTGLVRLGRGRRIRR